MSSLNPFSLVPALLALQFAVFGWRIAREVAIGDEGRRTWLLLSDFLNLASMLAIMIFCIILPLRAGVFLTLSRATLGVGYTLICFTPLIIAGHYRLYSRTGRMVYKNVGREYPWLTGQQAFLFVTALLAAAGAAYAIASG
jgi:hypothetical protein